MAKIETHKMKSKRLCSKLSHLMKKSPTIVSGSSPKKCMVIQGGVIHVQISSTQTSDGGYDITLKKVASRKENTQRVFVAGGAEVDRLVALANANAPVAYKEIVVHRNKLKSLKNYLFSNKT